MTSKERMLATVKRQPLDRPCVDYEATAECTVKMCSYLNQSDLEGVRQKLGSDLRNIVGTAPYIGEPFKPLEDGTPVDFFGVPDSKGTYSANVYKPPLAMVETVTEVEAYPWPNPEDFDYSVTAKLCDDFSDYAICGGAWSPFLCTAMHMTGMERFLELMAGKPEVAEAILTKLTDFFYEYSRLTFETCADKLDIFFMGDDYGTQCGPMVSPNMFKKLILPNLKRLWDLGKSYDLLVMMHSCGSIRAYLPDMIEAGLDMLDPIQVRAEGMKPEDLKRDFGKDLTFHGSIDTQHTLPQGSVQDVEDEVRSRLELFSEGGFICCGSQWYMEDIPPENIEAIYRVCESMKGAD